MYKTSPDSGYTNLTAPESKDNLKGMEDGKVVELLSGRWRPNYIALIIRREDGSIVSASTNTVTLEPEVRKQLDRRLTPNVPVIRSTETRQQRAF